jgi:hypothetical protein
MKIDIKALKDYLIEDKIEFFDDMYRLYKEYVNFINSKNFYDDNDFEHYFYECAVLNMDSEFFDKYNKKMEED